MLYWRDVRSVEDLKKFISNFQDLSEDAQSDIRLEMMCEIDRYVRMLREVKTKPPQAEKPLIRGRRSRTSRSSRRG